VVVRPICAYCAIDPPPDRAYGYAALAHAVIWTYAFLTMIVVCVHSRTMQHRARAVIAIAAAVVAVAVAAVGGLWACAQPSGGHAGGERVRVVAGFYPLQFVAEQVGGDRVSVTNLAPPGAEPHDMELSPRQVAEIADSDLVVYISGFQPALDEAVKQEAADSSFDAATAVALIDATAGQGHEEDAGATPEPTPASAERGKDPHLWLDPTRLVKVADALAERFAAVDPAGAAGYREHAASLRGGLEQLDDEYARALETCQRREIVVSHAAFGYLADRYRLDQIAISGLSPEVEPTPQRLAEVATEAREHGATTIFFETLVSPRVAQAIAAEVGAKTAVLDPIEGLQPASAGDYLSVMRANLATLRPALGCA